MSANVFGLCGQHPEVKGSAEFECLLCSSFDRHQACGRRMILIERIRDGLYSN
jgi:hypothetical protein